MTIAAAGKPVMLESLKDYLKDVESDIDLEIERIKAYKYHLVCKNVHPAGQKAIKLRSTAAHFIKGWEYCLKKEVR